MEFLRKFPKALLVIAISGCNLPGIEIAIPGDNLQAILDKGEDLVLKSGATYEITGTLRYKSKGQRIYTAEARYPSEYATLKLASKEVMMLINAGEATGTFTATISDPQGAPICAYDGTLAATRLVPDLF